MDLVSVIVPVYKVEKHLHRCVDSIINQTYKNLEIILVDDGSPDNCPAICDEYAKKDNRIKVIHKENGGVSSARNEGLKNLTGDYFGFIDSDDYVDNNYVEKLLNGFSDDVDIVISMYREIDVKSGKTKICRFVDEVKTVFIDKNFDFTAFDCNFFACFKLFRSSILFNQLFEENIYLGEDSLFVAEMIVKSKAIRYIPDCSYNYVLYGNSLTRSKITEEKLTLCDAWHKISILFAENGIFAKSCSQKYLSFAFWLYGLSIAENGTGSDISNKIFEIICSENAVEHCKNIPGINKTKTKYILLIRFRKLYDFILLVKEPFVKHYD